MSQAILTRVIPPTNTRPVRIKAECARGSIVITDWMDFSISSAEAHQLAAKRLCARFAEEDKKQYGTPLNVNPWSRHFASGCIKSGEFVHVFTE